MKPLIIIFILFVSLYFEETQYGNPDFVSVLFWMIYDDLLEVGQALKEQRTPTGWLPTFLSQVLQYILGATIFFGCSWFEMWVCI